MASDATRYAASNPAPVKPVAVGSETVVNPEGRGTPNLVGSDRSAPTSGVWNKLFPSPDAEPPVDPRLSCANVRLGHFVIEERIGSGGMGAVFRALDTRLDRQVALKILTPGQSMDQSSIRRFENEARAAAKLDHDNIARVFYIGEDEGLRFIAFEFVTGVNVRELIQQRGRFEPDEAINYTLQVAAALNHTSAAGVVHRDIKPSNIIVMPNGRAKLVDLGLARKESADASADLTLAGTTLGTFDYISPEQAKDPRNVDVRSDIYSLGCTLYHMLAGEPPYPRGTVLQKLLDHQGKTPPDPAVHNKRVTRRLSSIVRKMMSSRPDGRYQTPDDLIHDLMLAASELGLTGISAEGLIWQSSAPPSGRRFMERHLGWMATVVALLIITVLLERFPAISPPADSVPGSAAPQTTAGGSAATSSTDGQLALNDSNSDEPTPALPGPSGTPENGSTEFRPIPLAVTPSGAVTTAVPAPHDLSPLGTIVRPGGTGLETAATSDTPGASGDLFGDPALKPLSTIPSSPRSSPESIASSRPVAPSPGSNTAGSPGGSPRSPAVAFKPTQKLPQAGVTRDQPSSPAKPAPMPVPAAEQLPAISIVETLPAESQSFATLEAACAAAEEGSVIELRFNGRRQETPIRITRKNIAIRAARGFQPVIEFIPIEIPAEGHQTRMITVTGGSVSLINIGVELTVRDEIATDRWAIFSLQGTEQVRLRGVAVTLRNPQHRSAVVVEWLPRDRGEFGDMNMMKRQAREPLRFEIQASMLRGTGDLFLVAHNEPCRFDLQDVAVALDGNLLYQLGGSERAADAERLELKLDRCTCILGQSLVKVEAGDQFPRELMPLHVSARNNILSSELSEPLISMSGNMPPADFEKLLSWSGEKNFFDDYSNMWSISSLQSSAPSGQVDYDVWKQWGRQISSVGGENRPIVWRRTELPSEWSRIVLDDFALDQDALANPAVEGADDGSNAGVDLTQLGAIPGEAVLPPIPRR